MGEKSNQVASKMYIDKWITYCEALKKYSSSSYNYVKTNNKILPTIEKDPQRNSSIERLINLPIGMCQNFKRGSALRQE